MSSPGQVQYQFGSFRLIPTEKQLIRDIGKNVATPMDALLDEAQKRKPDVKAPAVPDNPDRINFPLLQGW